MFRNIKLLQFEHFFGSRLKVLKMAPYELNGEPSTFEEGSTKLSGQIIFHLTIEVINQVCQVIQGLMFELVHM